MKTEYLLVERDRASEALRESEQRYRRLLTATTDYIYTVNLDHGQTHSTFHGPGCEAVTGYSPSDFEKDPFLWYRIIHVEDRPAVLQQVSRILQGDLPPVLEHRIVHRNGSLRWIRNSTIPHRDSNGRLVGYDGVITDITEGRLAQEALETERKLLRTLVDNLPDYIFVKDTSRRFIMDNAAHVRALGANDADEVLGKTDAEFLPAAQSSLNRAAEEKVLRTGVAQYDVEELYVDPAGNQRWFSSSRVPLKDAHGKVMGLVGIKHDVTERKRSEQAVRESQERLALVIRGSNDGVWDWNLTTNETYFSPRWKSMLGYEDNELENCFSTWEGLLHPDDREKARQRVQAYLAGEMPVYELEHRLRHKDGSYRWILARGVLQRDASGRPIRMAGSHMDITDLKNAMEQLRKANLELVETQDQLIHVAYFEAVGTLAAGVAHQVKNPLQTILLGIHYLSKKLESPEADVSLTLSDMKESIERASTIIGDLLTPSRVTQFQLKSDSLNRVLKQCLRLTKIDRDSAGVATVLHLAEDLPHAQFDENKMEQVFLNLFVNAIQAMPSGGTLTITTRIAVVGDNPELVLPRFRKFRPGQRLVVAEVQDSGAGIPPADMARIYDPFYTTKPVGKGTGLGLFIAKLIIDHHGGAIDVCNAPEGGVLATVALKAEWEECL